MPPMCCSEEGCCITDEIPEIGGFFCLNEDASYLCSTNEISSEAFETCEVLADEFMY